MTAGEPQPWRAGDLAGRPLTGIDTRAERTLGALSVVVLILIALMLGFVVKEAWPSFAHNGLSWFGAQGEVDQQLTNIFNSDQTREYTIGAWPLIYSTFLITGLALACATVVSLLSAIFIVEFAPEFLRRLIEPIVRLLAAVPSVIYGLIGILVLVPFVGQELISEERRQSVDLIISLNGSSLIVAVVILTVMITPIMIAIIVDALRAVPSAWTEGAVALGVNRWRAVQTVTIRAARPAIIAAAVLASARALGEAIMLSMVSGSVGFAPNPLDGLTFLFEPSRPLASQIIENAEGLSIVPFGETTFAFAAVLLVSTAILSLGGSYIRRSLRRYTLTPT